jgi:cytochrome c biogenesis protein CcmG/thiol:disulfide interchange protein DsbE
MKKSTSKSHLWITALLLIAIVGVGAILIQGLRLNPTIVASKLVDKPAPDFEVLLFQDQSGYLSEQKNRRLSDFKGSPVILNFWASWCVSCREEARYFESFWNKHKSEGLIMLGVAIQDEVDASKAFAKQFEKTYILGLDTSGKASFEYGVTGVPETFFIDSEGVLRHREVGPMTMSMLEEKYALITRK